jgi:hypothetical protein
MKSSPAKAAGRFLVDVATVWLLLILLPLGIAGLVLVRAIEAIGDSRAWAAFARVWWGRPNIGR